MQEQSGFTIIELVVVIILLGILAATALPRFISVDDDARQASFQSVMGAVQTGVSMFHAKWVADGSPSQDLQFADFSNLRNNSGGYPYGTANRGSNDVTNSADCAAVFANVMQAGAPTVRTANSVNQVANRGRGYDYVAVASAPNCTFYYTENDPASGDDVFAMFYDSGAGSMTDVSPVTLP